MIRAANHSVSTRHIPLATVRRDCRDWRLAHVPLVDLHDLHWDTPTPRSRTSADPILWAFIACDAEIAGELALSENGAVHPETVRVCILRDDNDHGLFQRLLLEVGRPPRASGRAA
jgi:hypothetical protein